MYKMFSIKKPVQKKCFISKRSLSNPLFSAFVTGFLASQFHVALVFWILAIALLGPSVTIFVFIFTIISLLLAFSTRFCAIDIHVFWIFLAFTLLFPGGAVFIVIGTFVFAFATSNFAIYQHPVGIGLTFAHFSPCCTISGKRKTKENMKTIQIWRFFFQRECWNKKLHSGRKNHW